jgi:hypothetical protein
MFVIESSLFVIVNDTDIFVTSPTKTSGVVVVVGLGVGTGTGVGVGVGSGFSFTDPKKIISCLPYNLSQSKNSSSSIVSSVSPALFLEKVYEA